MMAEFGAESYSIPPDFVQRVNDYIARDCGPDRPKVAQALNLGASRIQTIRRILETQQMPADLAYIPIVESALSANAESAAGAVGPWQLIAPTARAYGLRVDGAVDERQDLVKFTQASCHYLKSSGRNGVQFRSLRISAGGRGDSDNGGNCANSRRNAPAGCKPIRSDGSRRDLWLPQLGYGTTTHRLTQYPLDETAGIALW